MSLHLVPAEQVGGHELHTGCPCGPQLEAAERPDGTFGLIVDHRDGPPPNDEQREE